MIDFRWVLRMTLYSVAMVVAAALIVAISVLLSVRFAKAEDPLLCLLYSREYVRVQLATAGDDVDLRTADAAYIEKLAAQRYYRCLNAEVPLPWPGEKQDRSTEAWAIQMSKLVLGKQGTVPATDDEDWRTQCREEYRTWRESDATVIRYNSRGKRVPCPYKPKT